MLVRIREIPFEQYSLYILHRLTDSLTPFFCGIMSFAFIAISEFQLWPLLRISQKKHSNWEPEEYQISANCWMIFFPGKQINSNENEWKVRRSEKFKFKFHIHMPWCYILLAMSFRLSTLYMHMYVWWYNVIFNKFNFPKGFLPYAWLFTIINHFSTYMLNNIFTVHINICIYNIRT